MHTTLSSWQSKQHLPWSQNTYTQIKHDQYHLKCPTAVNNNHNYHHWHKNSHRHTHTHQHTHTHTRALIHVHEHTHAQRSAWTVAIMQESRATPGQKQPENENNGVWSLGLLTRYPTMDTLPLFSTRNSKNHCTVTYTHMRTHTNTHSMHTQTGNHRAAYRTAYITTVAGDSDYGVVVYCCLSASV